MNTKKIAVLMATYNGEKYLREQINSILKQLDVELHIFVRDDGSSDRTVKILEEYIAEYPDKFTLLPPGQNDGHLRNFSALCNYAKNTSFDFYCFADQDDVWNPKKLKKCMFEAESSKLSKEVPLLVYSDSTVVDKNLVTINDSFLSFQGMPNPHNHDFPVMCHYNLVSGCTSLFNRKLLDLAAPIPKHAVIHDFWFALCAQFFGRVIYIDEPLILYRQHDSNSIGASSKANRRSLFNLDFYKAILNYFDLFPRYVLQCRELLDVGKHNSSIYSDVVEEFAYIDRRSWYDRLLLSTKFICNESHFSVRLFMKVMFILSPFLLKHHD